MDHTVVFSGPSSIIKTYSLKRIPDTRGAICHMIKNTDPNFDKFGEVYFSWIYPGQIKAWHYHHDMDLNYAVPVGRIRLLAYREGEHVMEQLYLGPENYQLAFVPHGVWNGFECVGNEPAMVVNCSTLPYSDNDIVRELDDVFGDVWYNSK